MRRCAGNRIQRPESRRGGVACCPGQLENGLCHETAKRNYNQAERPRAVGKRSCIKAKKGAIDHRTITTPQIAKVLSAGWRIFNFVKIKLFVGGCANDRHCPTDTFVITRTQDDRTFV